MSTALDNKWLRMASSKRMEKWLDDWSTVSGIDVNSSIELTEGYFNPTEEVQLFSIIQEAFTNIQKYSEAKWCDLWSSHHEKSLGTEDC